MAEAGMPLSLVPDGDRLWGVEHAIPGRIRIRAEGLHGHRERCGQFREFMLAQSGVTAVDVTPRIGTATIRYAQRKLSRRDVDALLQEALAQPLSAARRRPGTPAAGVDDSRITAMLLGLALTPVLPPPVRYLVTLAAISPTMWQAAVSLRRGGGASRALDAFAMLASTLAGRYGVAQVNNLMHTLGHKLEREAVLETEAELRRQGAPPLARCTVQRDGETCDCELTDLLAGDRMRLSAGDTVPLESLVLGGKASVAGGFEGGERAVHRGARVAAGARLAEGTLELVCLQRWSEGVYARLAGFIEIALRNRVRQDYYAAQLADRLVPFTVMISAAVYGFTRDLARTSSALQADFGASYELVTPISVESTIAAGAARGILFRGGEAIERVAQLDTVVFDRSGTLTRGEWSLVEVAPTSRKFSAKRCRELLSRLVLHCCRPAALAAAGEKPPPLATLTHAEVQQIENHGIYLRCDSLSIVLTEAEAAVQRFGVAPAPETAALPGDVVFSLLVEGDLVATVRCSDAPTPGAGDLVTALRQHGIRQVYLVSHESEERLPPELTDLPFDAVLTGLDELDKLHFIQQLADDGHRVGLVSDGLFRAGSDCVNICLGVEPDARPLDADVWLLQPELQRLVDALALATGSAARLRQSHRGSQVSKGAMLLASSFEMIPPTVAAAAGNAATLALMRYARNTRYGGKL